MNLETRKLSFIQEILRIQSEKTISRLETFLRKEKTVIEFENVQPMTLKKFNPRRLVVYSRDEMKQWEMQRKYVDDEGTKHYEIYGPLFFASTTNFTEKFDILNDPNKIIIDFKESRVADMSAIEALNVVTSRYHKLGKTVYLRHLSPDCRRLLKNAEAIIDVNIIEDPTYNLVGSDAN